MRNQSRIAPKDRGDTKVPFSTSASADLSETNASTALAASDTRRSEDRSSVTRESDPDSLGGPRASISGPETAAPLDDDDAGSDA